MFFQITPLFIICLQSCLVRFSIIEAILLSRAPPWPLLPTWVQISWFSLQNMNHDSSHSLHFFLRCMQFLLQISWTNLCSCGIYLCQAFVLMQWVDFTNFWWSPSFLPPCLFAAREKRVWWLRAAVQPLLGGDRSLRWMGENQASAWGSSE